MDRLRLDLYQGGLPWGNWQDVFLLPMRAVLLGVEGSPGYSASIGPLLFGLSLAAWLGWHALTPEQKRVASLATLVFCSGLLVWMVAGRFSSYLLQSRLYFALFPPLAVLAGAGYTALSQSALPGVRLGRIASVLVLLVLGLNVFELGIHTLNQGAFQHLLALRTSDAYLADNLGWYAPAMKELRELPADSRVLMLWETRSFYCWPACEPDETIDRWLRERYANGSASPRTLEEILHAWRQSGYTHLLFYRLGADFIRRQSTDYQPADWQALDDLLSRLSPVRDFGDAYTLYWLSP
jgi:hypothetical protein